LDDIAFGFAGSRAGEGSFLGFAPVGGRACFDSAFPRSVGFGWKMKAL